MYIKTRIISCSRNHWLWGAKPAPLTCGISSLCRFAMLRYRHSHRTYIHSCPTSVYASGSSVACKEEFCGSDLFYGVKYARNEEYWDTVGALTKRSLRCSWMVFKPGLPRPPLTARRPLHDVVSPRPPCVENICGPVDGDGSNGRHKSTRILGVSLQDNWWIEVDEWERDARRVGRSLGVGKTGVGENRFTSSSSVRLA